MIRIIERYEPDGKKQVVFMYIEKVALSQLNGLRLHAYDELQTSRGSSFLIRIRRRAQSIGLRIHDQATESAHFCPGNQIQPSSTRRRRNDFETDRLIVRPPVFQDASDIFRNYAQDAEVTKYLTWKPHTEYAQTEEWVRFCIKTANDESGLNSSFIIRRMRKRSG